MNGTDPGSSDVLSEGVGVALCFPKQARPKQARQFGVKLCPSRKDKEAGWDIGPINFASLVRKSSPCLWEIEQIRRHRHPIVATRDKCQ